MAADVLVSTRREVPVDCFSLSDVCDSPNFNANFFMKLKVRFEFAQILELLLFEL
jgi:hypothetical protein